MKFGMFQAAEFGAVLITSALLATLFLKGWEGPLLPSHLWFLLKVALFAFIFVWFRATLPRLRIDQIMAFAWKFLLPLSLLNIFVVAVEVLVFGEEVVVDGVTRRVLTTADMWIMGGINLVVALLGIVGLGRLVGLNAKESTPVAQRTAAVEVS